MINSKQKFKIKTNSGHLVGILEKPPGDKLRGTVLIVHGRKSHKGREGYIDTARISRENDYQAVRVDLRGHGESSDSPNWQKFGVVDGAEDIKAVVEWLKENHKTGKEFILSASSFFAESCLIFTARHKGVDKLILISPGLGKNSSGTSNNYKRQDWWDQAQGTTQIPFEQYRSLLGKVRVPVYLLHGDKDESVPINQSKELKRIIGDNAYLHVIKSGQHKYTQPARAMKQRQEIIKSILK